MQSNSLSLLTSDRLHAPWTKGRANKKLFIKWCIMNSFEKGKRWGYSIFEKNCDDFGKVGVAKSDKASRTCAKYVRDNKRQGKTLSPSQKEFFKGAVVGFQNFYNKFFG